MATFPESTGFLFIFISSPRYLRHINLGNHLARIIYHPWTAAMGFPPMEDKGIP
jgi:hypothetical protein